MRPRTKSEKTVTASNEKLTAIGSKAVDRTIRNVVKHISLRISGHRYTCGDCGRELDYKEKGKSARCPHCGHRLQTVDTLARKNKEAYYFSTLEAVDGTQVQHMLLLTVNYRKGKPMEAFCNEVCCLRLDSKGKTAVTSLTRTLSYYKDSFSWTSSTELRSMTDVHWVISNAYVYPYYSVIPKLGRNGMKGGLPNTHPMRLANTLLSDHHIKMMMKVKDLQAIAYLISHPHDLSRFWRSYKIATRHHYQPKDCDMWCNTIRLLDRYGRDIHSTKYIYPKDLKAEHDRWLSKMNLMEEERRNKERIERAKRHEADFYKNRSCLFGIVARGNDIEISVLDSLGAYKAEGERMRHCVFQYGYYTKTDAVILSAHDRQGSRIETVEFSLIKRKVVQSRGVCNSSTEFHDKIIKLVNDNAHHSLEAKATA